MAIGAALYIAGLHVILAIIIFNPMVIDNHRWRLSAMQRPTEYLSYILAPYFLALDAQAGKGRTVIIGDSHCHRLDTATMADGMVNFCAGGDTLANISSRIEGYKSVTHAETLIVWAGTNDFLHQSRSLDDFDAHVRKTLNTHSSAGKVLLLSLPPLGPERAKNGMKLRFQNANSILKQNCSERCIFIDLTPILATKEGVLDRKYDAGDGIHLNGTGYCAVTTALKPHIKAASC